MTDQLDLATVMKLLQQLQAQAAKPQGFAKAKSSLAKKDAQILKGFARKGIKDVVLMDRSDRSKPFNVKPFKAWVADGRIVRKGQHGVKGLFHVSQTDKLVQSEAKPVQPKSANPNKDKPKLTVHSFADLAKAADEAGIPIS